MSENVCAICAKGELGCVSCCISPFIEKDPGFWLTFKDVARIVKKTGLEPEEFCRLTELEEGEDDDEDADEEYADLVYYGDKVILMNDKEKKRCYFLGERGCKIFDARPKMCQVYPFWFTEKKGKIKVIVQHEDELKEDDCYLTKSNFKNYNLKHLLKCMGETEEEFIVMIKEYIKEMKEHDKIKSRLKTKSIKQILEDNSLI